MPKRGKSGPRWTASKYKQPSSFQVALGLNLKQARIKENLTQEQLAEMAAISIDTVKRYESGKHNGSRVETVCKIATALGVPIQDLLPMIKRF